MILFDDGETVIRSDQLVRVSWGWGTEEAESRDNEFLIIVETVGGGTTRLTYDEEDVAERDFENLKLAIETYDPINKLGRN